MVSSLFGVASASQLFAAQQTAQQIELLQKQISTKKRVSSALDNVDSFVASVELDQKVIDLNNRLDAITDNFGKIDKARAALSDLSGLFSSQLSELKTQRNELAEDRQDLGDIILGDDPLAYFKLNDDGGSAAVNQGNLGNAVDGTYLTGTTNKSKELYIGINNKSTYFDGTTSGITIPDHSEINTGSNYTERSIELVFEATNLSGRQVIYEEGGNVNSINVYLDDDQLYIETRDQGSFGPFGIHTQVKKGETYHVALTFNSDDSEFNAYVNGALIGAGEVTNAFPSHGGDIGIGFQNDSTYFHDGASSGGDKHRFQGFISDVALYDTTLSHADVKKRYNATQLKKGNDLEQDILDTLGKIEDTIDEASSLGVNLLRGGRLGQSRDSFSLSSFNLSEDDFSFSSKYDFRSLTGVSKAISQLEKAVEQVDKYKKTFDNARDSLQIKTDFLEDLIAETEAGSQRLTELEEEDQGKAETELKLLQTRQLLQYNTIGLTSSINFLQSFIKIGGSSVL